MLAYVPEIALGKKVNRRRPRLRLIGTSKVPTVNVFICYCGEGPEVLQDTVEACLALDYPSEKFWITVLDDSSSAEVDAFCSQRSQSARSLRYAARGAGVSTHAKAGNINFGLEESDKSGTRADYVGVLDVDMIPEKQWLRALLPHLMKDSSVGMANPPQAMYNFPADDVLGLFQEYFPIFDKLLLLQDAVDSAWCTGTGFVVRRKALDDIGGFPTISASEDLLVSVMLQSKGWRVVYVNSVLQWGVQPHTYTSHLRQRQRICNGLLTAANVVQTSKDPNIKDQQRKDISSIANVYALTAIFNTASIFLLPVLALTGKPLVGAKDAWHLRLLLMASVVDFLGQCAYGAVDSFLSGGSTYILAHKSFIWSLPYRAATALRTYLGRSENFRPSGIDEHADKEISEFSLLQRLKRILIQCGGIGHVFILISSFAVVAVSSRKVFDLFEQNNEISTIYGLSLAFWPSMMSLWSAFISQSWIPISYAIWPPPKVDRRALLERQGESDVYRPTAKAMANYRKPVPETRFWLLTAYWVGFVAFAWPKLGSLM